MASSVTTCIVVVTYNSEQYIPELFASLREHTDLHSGKVRLVVVDNASADGTRARLAEEEARTPHVTIVAMPDNTGFTGANNRGFSEARRLGARYAMCLNPDVVVAPGWLDGLVEVLDARADVAAAQPLILLHGTDRVNTSGNRLHFCGFGYCGDYGRLASEVMAGPDVRPVAYCSGAAMLLRVAALDEIGDFYEPLFLYHEDCELQLRLRQAGWECVTVFTTHVFHKYAPGFSKKKYYWLERNRLWVLLQTWPGELIVASAPALLGSELAVLAFSVLGGWSGDKLRIYGELARRLPEIRRMRRERLGHRRVDARDIQTMTGELQFDGLDHWVITKLANPVLERYFRVVRRVLDRATTPASSRGRPESA